MNKNSLTQGPIFKAIVTFSLPLIVTNTISILFHASDVAVLAFFAEGPAVAAVGACGSLITLLVSIFTGLAAGANVLISKCIGAQDEKRTKSATGTSLMIGVISGILLMVVALIFAKRLLILMNCQPEVLDMATLYLRIYFLGMPVMMLNNFALAALRASGDSVRPMYYMIISGCVNVVANIFFVTLLNMSVAGVALATVLSSSLSLVFALIRLFRGNSLCKIGLQDLKIRKNELFEIVRVGIPTCFCSIFFYIANVIITSAVNSMSTEAMTANAISGQFDGIIYTVGSAIAVAASVMVAQNYGAQNFERIRKTITISILYGTAISLTLGALFVLFAEPMLRIMSDDPTVIGIAKERMILLCLTYFVTTIMEIFAFSLRALKREKTTMVVGAICGLGVRCLWTLFIWPLKPTLPVLYSCFALSALLAIIIYLFVYRNVIKTFHQEKSGTQAIN
jgi:putative MATE family efflux protein